jgi:SHR-binding domain of vacuolar-sorting associated protein 13
VLTLCLLSLSYFLLLQPHSAPGVKRAYFVLIYSCEGDEIIATNSSNSITTTPTTAATGAAANTTSTVDSDVHNGELASCDTTVGTEQLQSSCARPSVVIPDSANNADSATAAILSAPSTADSVDFADSFSTAIEDADTAAPSVSVAPVTTLTVEVPNEHSSDSSATTAAVTASSSTAVTPTAAAAPATATATAPAPAATAVAAVPAVIAVPALERLSPVWDTAQHGPITQCAVPFDSEGRHWSQRFSVNAVSTSGELLTPCAAFGVTIAALPGLYRRTRVVTLYPRFVVRNDLRVPLQVRFNCLNFAIAQ